MNLSIIIPVYNSAESIANLVASVGKELGNQFDLEIVLVNDGSTRDNSAEVCERLARNDPAVKFLDLSKNFGEHNAVMAGLNYCSGDAAVIIDDDFQNPPSEIARLVDKLSEGYDVVFSRYESKKHSLFRNVGSAFNNLVASVVIGKPLDLYLSSFKALNRFVIDELVKYRGPYPYIDGLILRVSNKYDSVLVAHHEREAGRSGYTIRKLISLWLRMFVNFSVLPLRLATIGGLILSIFGGILAIAVVYEKYTNPDLPLGWASLIVTLLIVSGMQLFAMGMLGEYLGRLYMQDNGTPQYVVRNAVNCERKDEFS